MIFSTLTKTEMIVWLAIGLLATLVGFLMGKVFTQRKQRLERKADEINKEQVKKDILEWAKSIREANEKLIKVYEGLGEIYKEVKE